MFQATCDKCGKECEVPFRPSGGKPVYCSDCFGNKSFGKKGFGNKSFGSRGSKFQKRSGDRQMHQATCDKCGKECEVPFRPTAGKPIYCNDCFGKDTGRKERHGGGSNDQVSQQLKSLSNKLDKILNLLESGLTKKETTAKTAPKKLIASKKTAKKTAKKKK
jgi:CxxC-x17-CxxC domain-containing protein